MCCRENFHTPKFEVLNLGKIHTLCDTRNTIIDSRRAKARMNMLNISFALPSLTLIAKCLGKGQFDPLVLLPYLA